MLTKSLEPTIIDLLERSLLKNQLKPKPDVFIPNCFYRENDYAFCFDFLHVLCNNNIIHAFEVESVPSDNKNN